MSIIIVCDFEVEKRANGQLYIKGKKIERHLCAFTPEPGQSLIREVSSSVDSYILTDPLGIIEEAPYREILDNLTKRPALLPEIWKRRESGDTTLAGRMHFFGPRFCNWSYEKPYYQFFLQCLYQKNWAWGTYWFDEYN